MIENETGKTMESERETPTGEKNPAPPSAAQPPDSSAGRRQQLDRIKTMRGALLPKAMEGDVRSVGAILKCDERELKLLKIDDEKLEHKYVFSWIDEEEPTGEAVRPTVWHTPGECAAILGVSPKTVRRAVERGDLPAVRTPGGHCRVRREDLERYRDATAKKRADKSVKPDKPDKSDNPNLEIAENAETGFPLSRE
jgi:excisionase family DNA binding protein